MSSICRNLPMAVRTVVPGLSIWKPFLPSSEEASLLSSLSNFREKILSGSITSETRKGRNYLSRQHNLETSEEYKLVHLANQTFQYFDSYGGKGHSLTYGIGNQNIPDFVKAHLISKILQLPEMKVYKEKALDWNFTFNTYSVDEGKKLAGFPRHKDIPENGIVTFIYSLGAPSEFEIEDPITQKVYRYPLLSGSLLGMREHARWECLHAVVPQTIEGSLPFLRKDEHRYSAVLGFHEK
ncbi:MAG: hypothetical protein SNF33_02295 [Candidatus Algichlamydia australiensis]|nr:hypothetical protein [Chlamydiales bacterium]